MENCTNKEIQGQIQALKKSLNNASKTEKKVISAEIMTLQEIMEKRKGPEVSTSSESDAQQLEKEKTKSRQQIRKVVVN